MKIYHIEDNPAQRAYLPALCALLERKSGWAWSDGYGEYSEVAWHDPHLLWGALSDSDSIILLDIGLNDGGSGLCASAQRELEAILRRSNINYGRYKSRDIASRGGNYAELSAIVLAAGVALNRQIFIASTLGFAPRAAWKLGINSIALPTGMGRADYVTQALTDCADDIWQNIGGFTRAEREFSVWRWNERQQHRLFGKRFHDVASWEDPARENRRPISASQLVTDANDLLLRSEIEGVEFDFPVAVRTLKALDHSSRYLAVAAVEAVLGQPLMEGGACVPRGTGAPSLGCSHSAGRALRALAQLHGSRPNSRSSNQPPHVQWQFEIDCASDGGGYILAERVTFASHAEAVEAASEIQMPPRERRFLRDSPGNATEARYWLAQEAQTDCASVETDGPTLVLTFRFSRHG